MNSIGSGSVLQQSHSTAEFAQTRNEINKIESNTGESASKIQAVEETNKAVDQQTQSEKNKFSQESDSQVRKALMSQLNSPFPLFSTETRLKAM